MLIDQIPILMAQSETNTIQSPSEGSCFPKFYSLFSHRSLEQAVWIFCELGMADLMANHKVPITAMELSRLNENNWNAEFLYRLLRAVTNADVIEPLQLNDENSDECNCPEQSIRFRLTDDGYLLTSSHPCRARYVMLFELSPRRNQMCSFGPSLIKNGYQNGDGCQQAFGCSFYEYMQKPENKDFADAFNNAMVAYSDLDISAVISVLDFSRFNTCVDIGGGLGSLLSSFLEKFPNMHGILFDLPHVIETSKAMNPNEFEKKLIETDRYAFVAGDMFQADMVPLGDAYLLKNVIHNWNTKRAIEILRSIRHANEKQVGKTITVFILETVVGSNSKEHADMHALDLEMLAILGSKERTLSEYISLLKGSQYNFKKLHRTPSQISIIEAVLIIGDGH